MPRSETIKLSECFESLGAPLGSAPRGAFELPPYQRDLVWSSEKIVTLWEDMLQHAIENPQMTHDRPFFLGTIVTQNTNPVFLVDGQQRFTAAMIIASAIRDSLIAVKNIGLAWEVDKKLLNHYHVSPGPYVRESRFKPLDSPPGDDLSSEKKLQPYRKRILDIDTNTETLAGSTGDPTIATRGVWNWGAIVGDWIILEDVNGDLQEYELQGEITEGSNAPTLSLNTPLRTDVDDSRVLLKNEVKWPDEDINDSSVSDVYEEKLRDAYIRIRTDVEHYILQEKKYSNPKEITYETEVVRGVTVPKRKVTHIKPHASITDNKQRISTAGDIGEGSTIEFKDSVGTPHNFELQTPLKFMKGDRLNFSGYCTSGTVVPVNSIVSIKYGGDCTVNAHLNTQGVREQLFSNLVLDIEFSRVDFSTAADAVNFFTRTNDSARMSSLTIFDLMLAFTQELVGPNPTGTKLAINTEWAKIKKTIYTDLGNDAGKAVDFFYQWMMATKRWDGNSRWESKDCWTGLWTELSKNYFDRYTGWDDPGILEDYKEMVRFSKIYIEAINPESISKVAARYNERVYLQILNQANYKQHLPGYMAIRDRFTRFDTAANRNTVVSEYLKNWIYVYLRYVVFPTECRDKEGKGYSSQNVHHKVVGKEKWVDRIHELVSSTHPPTAAERTEIGEMPRELEPVSKANYPWVAHSPDYKKMEGNRTLIFAHERALHGAGNKLCSNLFDPIQVEHVLPKDPSEWGPKWYDSGTKKPKSVHSNCLERLGNKVLLEQDINGHCSKQKFKEKVMGGEVPCTSINLHIKDSSMKTAAQIKTLHDTDIAAGKLPSWTKGKIIHRSTIVMNEIVNFFN